MKTTTDKKLDQLFTAIRNDAPQPLENELDQLLNAPENSEVPYPLPPTLDHKRKGRTLMTTGMLVALLGAATYFGIQLQSTPDKGVTDNGNFTTVADHAPSSLQSKAPIFETTPKLEKDTFKILNYSKAPVTALTVPLATDEELDRLAIRREDDGSIILDEDYTSQIEFPIDTFAHQAAHDSRPQRIPYELFPQFVTDSKGALIMIGEHKLVKNDSRSSSITLLADMPSSLPKLNYYRTASQTSWDGTIDSSVTPPMYTVHWKMAVGIMSLDTIVRFHYGYEREESAIRHSIIERLAIKDSLCKLKFGGESGLTEKFGNALTGNTLTTLEQRLLKSIDSVGHSKTTEVENAEAQFMYLKKIVSNPNYPEVERLKFERLSRVYNYKYYLLQHQENEKKFALINSYIPVVVRRATGKLPNKAFDNGLVFWYKPSEHLSAALPKTGNTERSVATSTESAIELKAYPNPASYYLFVNYKLGSGSAMMLELRDLLGHTVLGPISRSNVSGNIQFDVSHVAPGMYLLVAASDKGEQQVQRIIVQKP